MSDFDKDFLDAMDRLETYSRLMYTGKRCRYLVQDYINILCDYLIKLDSHAVKTAIYTARGFELFTEFEFSSFAHRGISDGIHTAKYYDDQLKENGYKLDKLETRTRYSK